MTLVFPSPGMTQVEPPTNPDNTIYPSIPVDKPRSPSPVAPQRRWWYINRNVSGRREHHHMRIALYTAWLIIPTFYLTLALWAKLERLSSRGKRGLDAGDLARHGIFVLVAAVVSLAVDTYLLLHYVEPILPAWLPIGVLEIALFPLILGLQAVILGPSRDIVIISRHNKSGGTR